MRLPQCRYSHWIAVRSPRKALMYKTILSEIESQKLFIQEFCDDLSAHENLVLMPSFIPSNWRKVRRISILPSFIVPLLCLYRVFFNSVDSKESWIRSQIYIFESAAKNSTIFYRFCVKVSEHSCS